jgi:3-methyladenine DNA glycosylase/8-oxoguanine DNA glycosylase
MERAAARWAPYRSTASWYLWRATELPESVFLEASS